MFEATIILLNGESVPLIQWQRMYGLIPGSSQVGKHFDIGEPSFNNGLTISECIIRFLDVLRVKWGKPIYINSLDRTEADQERLRNQGYRAATTSPHVSKLAADIDTTSKDETYDLLECIDEVKELLEYDVRIGWESYMKIGQTFIHIDVCPMYFKPGAVWHDKNHPKVWENTSGEW